jgi:hypothetical protein
MNNLLDDNPAIFAKIQHYKSEFIRIKQDILEHRKSIETVLELVSEWRYSNGDYFDSVPYRSEILGGAAAKLLKKSYPSSDAASLRGMHSSGFSSGKHFLTRFPSGKTINAVRIRKFSYDEDVQFFVETTGYRLNIAAKCDVLRAVGETHIMQDRVIRITYAEDDNYSVNLLLLDSRQRVMLEYIFAKGWSTNAIYKFKYGSEGQLIEVSNPGKLGARDIVIWSSG